MAFTAPPGFVTPEAARSKAGSKNRRLMILSEGLPNTGKTEFSLSAPGPGLVLCLDRGFDAMYDNPTPPKYRRDDFLFKIIHAPTVSQASQAVYLEHWQAYLRDYLAALAAPGVNTVVLDGDSDSWELQRLAEHGKLTGIFPQTRYTDVYGARRALVNLAWDSGKIIISTNKLKREYKVLYDKDGKPVMDTNGKDPVKVPTGEMERAGFPDSGYLWQIQIRHLYDESDKTWGIRILEAKANPDLKGVEFWGENCNFQTLVQNVYPNVPLEKWGY